MSFGSETGRARSGTKGISGKARKSLKRKKQEYHLHKRARFQESQTLNPEELRARTIIALEHLGRQVLSNEPGGYDLEDWLRSLDSLLDDFKERLGPGVITDEFNGQVEAALSPLALPKNAAGEPDPEGRRLSQEEADARGALAEIRRRAEERHTSLKSERETCARELKLEREKLAGMKAQMQSRGLFSRLKGSGPSTAQTESRVAELESKLAGIETEIHRSRANLEKSGPSGSDEVEVRERLESIVKRLAELQAAKESRLQLARERELATKQISEMISSLKLEVASPVEGQS